MSKKELLSLDFEGILKYFRVSLPKKYRNEDVARQLFKVATATKVKKIKKYEKEYLAIKGQMFPLFSLSSCLVTSVLALFLSALKLSLYLN